MSTAHRRMMMGAMGQVAPVGGWVNIPVVNQDFELPVIPNEGDRVFFNTIQFPNISYAIEGWWIAVLPELLNTRVAYRHLASAQIDGGAYGGINGIYSHEILYLLESVTAATTSVEGTTYRLRIQSAYQKAFANTIRFGQIRIKSNGVVKAEFDFTPVENVWNEYSVEYVQDANDIGDITVQFGAAGVKSNSSIILYDALYLEKQA